MVVAVAAVGVSLTHFGFVSAAVTEGSIVDLVTNEDNNVGGGAIFDTSGQSPAHGIFKMELTADNSETLNSLSVTFNNVSGAASDDFSRDLGGGPISIGIAFDSNNNDAFDFGVDALLGFAAANPSLDTPITISLSSPHSIPSSEAGNWNYVIFAFPAADATNGAQFSVTLHSYTLSSGTLSSNTDSGTVTIFNPPTGEPLPVAAGTSAPSNGTTTYIPSSTIQVGFDRPVSSTTANTTNVVVKVHEGNTQGGALTGSNLCSSVYSQPVNGISDMAVQCNLNSQMLIDTWYTLTLSTGIVNNNGGAAISEYTRTFKTAEIDTTGNVTPPHIIGSAPNAGQTDFAPNGNIVIDFESNLSGEIKTSGTGSPTSSDSMIMLQKIVNGAPNGTNLCASSGCAITFTYNQDQFSRLVINPTSNLDVNSEYELKLSQNIRNNKNLTLGNDYIVVFNTAAGLDSTGPSVESIHPVAGSTGVERNLSNVRVQYNEPLDQDTIHENSVKFYLDVNANGSFDSGSEVVATTSLIHPDYRPVEKAVYIGFKQLLAANTQYCFESGSQLQDLVGNSSISSTNCFTTASSYTPVAPTLVNADVDEFVVWAEFDQPISGAATGTFTLESPVGTAVDLTYATLEYMPAEKAVRISDFSPLTADNTWKLSVSSGVKELGGTTAINSSLDEVFGTVLDSDTTGGSFVAGDFGASTNFNEFWENPEYCAPHSLVASTSGKMFCEFPVPAALTTGAQIVLEAPFGFDVSNVTVPTASESFANEDINGFGPGVTTISAIAKNAAARTITLTLAHSGDAMQANDQLVFELDGIANPPNAVEDVSFSYFVKNSSGVKQGQTKNFAPITIGAAGGSSISGTVCKSAAGDVTCDGDTAIANVPVFLDSFGGAGGGFGHQETTTDGSGNYSFTGLGEGQYGIGIAMDPTIVGNVGGGAGFQEVPLGSSETKTNVDFHLTAFSTGGGGNAQTLTVNVTGAPANEEMDIFCFAPGDFEFSAPIMKKVTANGSGAVSSSNTLTLAQNTPYECGIGPSIPFDMLSSGASEIVPDFTFMPPEPQQVHIGTADKTITFALQESTHEIKGKVIDGDGTGIANVFVDAFPPFGKGFDDSTGEHKDIQGSFTKTNASGEFTLKVLEGTYEISSCAPGMPCSTTYEVSVQDNSDNSDGNTAADVYSNGYKLSGTGLSVRMAKKGKTIAGQVLDENGSAIQYAFVHAEKGSGTCSSWTPAGGGHADSPTDSSGNYTLYVDANTTYRVEAHAPSYGRVACEIFSMVTTDLTGKNLQASSGDFGTISGTVTKAGSNVSGAFINCFGSSGTNQKVTGSDGTYSMKVPAGTYSCDSFLSGAGHLNPSTGSFTISGGGTQTVNFSMSGEPGYITIDLGSSVTEAFCDARDGNGKGNGTGQNDNGVYTIYVPAGTYTVRCGGPNIGELEATGGQVVTAGTETVVSLSPPTLYTITGTITDGSNNLSGAAVTFVDEVVGAVVFEQSDGSSSGANVSASLPAGTYNVIASKSGYVDTASPQSLTVSANGTFTTRSLTQAAATQAVTVQASGSNYTGGAKVIATRSDGKVTTADVDPTISSGVNATLTLTEGTWTVEAFGDNGKKATGLTLTVDGADNVTVSAGSTTMSLATAITGFTKQESTTQSLVPKNGGIFKDDTIDDAIGEGFEVNIPAGVLSTSDSSAGSVITELDPTLAISTPGKTFVGTAAISITPKNSSGKAIKDLSSSGQAVTLKIPYDPTDLPSGAEESDLKAMVWSDAADDWQILPSAVDIIANVIVAQTTHFSDFGAGVGSGGGSEGGGGEGGESGGGSEGSGSSGGGLSVGVNPPTIPADTEALVINDGDAETAERTVTLTISAESATLMALSNDGSFEDAVFVDYTSTTTWELSEGDGEKTVTVRLRSAEGGSLDATDTITLTGQGFEQVEPVELITSCGLTPHKAYRALGSNAVYYVGEAHNEDGTVKDDVACAKRPFRSATKYFTYFDSWDDVVVTTQTALDSIPDDVLGFMPWGPQYDPKYGALVKVVTDPKVYLLLGTNKHWITSEAIFTGLKYAWNWIEDIADGLLDKYDSAGEIQSTDTHPNYTIIKYEGDAKVYRLEPDPEDAESQVKRHIADEAAFEALTFRWDRIVTVPDTEVYEDGEPLTAE